MAPQSPARAVARALLSVSDKSGLVEFARGLSEQGVELVASDSNTATLRIDGQTRQFGLQREYTEGFAQTERQQVSIPRGEGGHFRVTGSINGHHTAFMVDTGATSVAMNANQARPR